MSKKNQEIKTKIRQVVDLLKFVLTLENEEDIVKSTIESVIEVLEEIGE